MTSGPGRIEVRGLTKQFQSLKAVDDLSFTVEAGSVTGFLGPNGAGKTTTLRMILGLITPDAGTATIGGHPYTALPAPAREVGAALEATGFHPARSGRDHLRVLCTVGGFPPSRADAMLDMVGLTAAARRPVGGYSLGMRQRLALAAALLGDPKVLLLDEPANGLDPQGIAWIRQFLRSLADEGRTVLVSSHVLSEMQQLVDHVVIINKGRAVHQGRLADLSATTVAVTVRSPHTTALAAALDRATTNGTRIERTGPDALSVTGMTPADIGRLAHTERIELHELSPTRRELEQLFFTLTHHTEERN
ncbi:ATP-binding cassette domain-containing protein [Streptomyces chiangmaiensis]|uniref:ATP-binding cassette domain-containing protein n=1 Tax=Streptomyces chiangmaiensis TaxID=766497 RepID=A0ABU7FSC2_9ACTN|nr:ATP-binding cassette domain-containing protein [Streptomyces chiangmaiensis]MED7826733.1 ATP-binding cassette domain-containing protein [Streptomyces chiangmaiensis]